MAERRALIEGLSEIENIDPQQAEEFIYEKPRKTKKQTSHSMPPESETDEESYAAPAVLKERTSTAQVPSSAHLTSLGRVPINARVRPELASDLKRASLERQLQGIQPSSIQEILEEAIELWLLKHGHRK